MLERLLNEIKLAGTAQPAQLAARLGTSPAMVEAMLASLERMGMIRLVDAACSQPCTGCPLESGCVSGAGKGRLWMVKG